MRCIAFALLIAGCYSPSVGDCEYACGANNACPSGLECHANACRVAGALDTCDAIRDGGGGDDGGGSGSGTPDAPDAVPPRKMFGNASQLMGLTGYTEPSLTDDEQNLYAVSNGQIVHLVNDGTNQGFGSPSFPPHVNGGAGTVNATPSINHDGTVLYFTYRATPVGSTLDVYHCSRTSTSNDFDSPIIDPLLATPADERPGTVNMTANRMILTLGTGNASDLYESKFEAVAPMWSMPTRLDGLSSAKEDSHPSLSGDGKTVVFASNRGGDNLDLYIARRPALDMPFEQPEAIGELNTVAEDGNPWLSPDGTVIYFTRGLGANTTLYRAETSH
ncbi:MAG TPA: hypothetical protein VGM90_06165 [Kofleriaceae bacterium]|jgi:hypothetical protein